MAFVACTFSGHRAFAQHIRDALSVAVTQGWHRMAWSDVDFADWPLCEKQVFDALHAWAGPGRSLTVLAKRYDKIVRMHPRFVQWRVTWSHLVDCRLVKQLDDTEMPSALWGPNGMLLRHDPRRSIGLCTQEPRRSVELQERLEACWKHSTPGFPATTLGL